MTRTIWNGPAFQQHLQQQMEKALRAGGETLRDEIHDSVSVLGPPRSSPAHPPHVDHGDLMSSIVTAFSAAGSYTFIQRTGSTDPKAIFLERGTTRMAARPFIVPTLLRSRTIIAAAMGRAVI